MVKNLSEEHELELIDSGAKDFDDKTIITEANDLKKVEEKAKQMGLEIEESGVVMRSKSPIELANIEQLDEVMNLVESLEENDDVVNVFAGFDYHE